MAKLSNYFPHTAGIFTEMANLSGSDLPWKSRSIDSTLDLEYTLLRSGDKTISPLIEKLLSSDGTLTSTNKSNIASVIYQHYLQKWTKLYNTLSLQYNPIENYSMTETHTGTDTTVNTPTNRSVTETETPTNWKTTSKDTPSNDYKVSSTQTPTNWKTTEQQNEADNQQTTTHDISAFNSDSYEDGTRDTVQTKHKLETTQSGTFATETTQTGYLEHEVSQTGTYSRATSTTGTLEDKTTYNTTLSRSGNIGVTTSQQMIESERDLWLWDYFEIVFKDIDKSLTIPIYE